MILEKQVAGLSGEALGRFVLRARKAVGLRGQVGVLVTSSAALRALNYDGGLALAADQLQRCERLHGLGWLPVVAALLRGRLFDGLADWNHAALHSMGAADHLLAPGLSCSSLQPNSHDAGGAGE